MSQNSIQKKELIRQVAKDNNFTIVESKKYLEALLTTIEEQLQQNVSINLRGFGKFETRQRKQRRARNPRTGKEVQVPPKATVTFSPSPALKKTIPVQNP